MCSLAKVKHSTQWIAKSIYLSYIYGKNYNHNLYVIKCFMHNLRSLNMSCWTETIFQEIILYFCYLLRFDKGLYVLIYFWQIKWCFSVRVHISRGCPHVSAHSSVDSHTYLLPDERASNPFCNQIYMRLGTYLSYVLISSSQQKRTLF